MVARRRCLRRGGARGADGPCAVRRDRAGRLLHRRPAQVALRPLRLLRAALPGAGDRPRRPTPSTPAISTRSRRGEWNPSDYAINLTRRARGMPFWFSLATHGTDAYVAGVERTLAVARFAAEEIRERRPELELLREPDLSVVAFRRLGWSLERLRDLVGAPAGAGHRVRHRVDARRGGDDAVRGGQPAHDRGRHRADPRHDGLGAHEPRGEPVEGGRRVRAQPGAPEGAARASGHPRPPGPSRSGRPGGPRRGGESPTP